jgi:antitoxin MazE
VVEHNRKVSKQVLCLQRFKKEARVGWQEYAQSLALAGEGGLVLGEFANEEDGDWAW